MIRKQFIWRKISLGITLYCLTIIGLFGNLYRTNYGNSQGVKLANGREAGGDFICFYAAGKIAATAPQKLYDFDLQFETQKAIIAGSGIQLGALPFIYPPLIALLFSLFSSLTLLHAYALWALISLIFFSISVCCLLRERKVPTRENAFLFVLALSFVPFFLDCIGSGQTSCLGLGIITGVYLMTKREKPFLAGVILGLSYYKPPLFLFFVLSCFVQKNWKLLAGFFLSGLTLVVLSVSWIGWREFWHYVTDASRYTYGAQFLPQLQLPTSKGIGLYALLSDAFGPGSLFSKFLFVVSIVALLGLIHRLSKRRFPQNSPELFFALQTALSLLVSIQMNIYDLTLLILPLVLVYQYLPRIWSKSSAVLITSTTIAIYLEWTLRTRMPQFLPARISFIAWCLTLMWSVLHVAHRSGQETT